MADETAHFTVGAGLKNIIGGELITDDFVAIFELVKNSYDAHASEVTVRFESIGRPDKAALIITDNGKGMTSEDLMKKWLWVAYSAKKDGTEDEGLRDDYRSQIGLDRPFAGAKGIGRFSCERLGRHLEIYTRRDNESEVFEMLMVDWQKFEVDDRRRFEDIDIAHGQASAELVPGVSRGTRIRISDLRSQWDDKRLLRLREELQKLTSPDDNTKDGRAEHSFRIIIEAPDYADRDRREPDESKRVNGAVKNFLFEKLQIKTTEITCTFSETGKTIETELRDRGQLIYKIVEPNENWSHLRKIKFRIFYLNRAAKYAFKKTVGVEPVRYGSVLLYKNGVRVQPYGKQGDDGYAIDRRKQQGSSRYLGTRDMAGRINITTDSTKSHERELFKEASSRNAGLIESVERDELFEYFKETVLRRLESYVVDVIKWGNPPKHEDESMATNPGEARNEIFEMVKRLTDSKKIVRFEADPDLLTVVNERQAGSVQAILNNIEQAVAAEPNSPIANEAHRLKREMETVLRATTEAADEARSERRLRYLSEKQLATERQQNSILKGLVTPAEEQRAVLQHWVGIIAKKISQLSLKAIGALQGGERSTGKVDHAKALDGLVSIKFEADKLLTLSNLVAESGFTLQAQKVPGDLSRYFFECLDHHSQTAETKIEIAWDSKEMFLTNFRPIEIAMLVDNLVDNALKAGCKKIQWTIDVEPKRLRVRVVNDGRPLPEHMRSSLFQLGATSTHGHGLGLFTCRRIVHDMQGEMMFLGNDSRLGGAIFEMTFLQ